MLKAEIEDRLLREFRKLSQEGKGEVPAYTKWMRDIEAKERVRNAENSNRKG